MEQNIDVNAIVHDRLNNVWKVLTKTADDIRAAPQRSIFSNKFEEASEYDVAAHKLHALGEAVLHDPDPQAASGPIRGLIIEFALNAQRHTFSAEHSLRRSTTGAEEQKAHTFDQCVDMLESIAIFISRPSL